MQLPDMSCAVEAWSSKYQIRKTTKVTIDFEDQNITDEREIKALIQPAQKRKLNPDLVDWSLRYQTIHSLSPIVIGEELTYKSIDYKVVDDGDYDSFGYTEGVLEEIRRSNVG